MLTLINTNTMQPAIAPIGLDYIAGAARQAGIEVEVVDLCLADDTESALRGNFSKSKPDLIGLSLRNVDDCFWPSCQWFIPQLADTVRLIRSLTDSPIVIGGVGFSIFAKEIVAYTGAEFGVCGDGEPAIIKLYGALHGAKHFENIPGLVWRKNDTIHTNLPAWDTAGPLSLPTSRDAIDNAAYFRIGGQCGIETKRGCDRQCIYCADRLCKGTATRLRNPVEVADEAESLLKQGINVLHICDSEFNIPGEHAMAVCEEFIRRGLGKRLRWYTYMAVVPFDGAMASAMRKAGCVGIDFTGDSASSAMLKTYRQPHTAAYLDSAVRFCRENGIKVMIDLLLGGPGETPETVKQTIDFIKRTNPDCAGAPLGVRVYPGTEMVSIVAAEGNPDTNPNLRRKYTGPIDLFKPTFYISHLLGEKAARLVKDLIDGDKRFFEPIDEADAALTDHNYNENAELVQAIKRGARGAYWEILRKLRA
ncbi:MAG: cobalamin-dependent protein [Sedimentisphaerales bacterium]|nr:cobalamin-dependent protein [Sedimentisphaerales bacterium]